MDTVAIFIDSFVRMLLEAAPWLVFGLIVSGLLKAYLPPRLLSRWLGGRGVGPVLKAAVIGTPLPLCSCSVIPAALTVRRGGASRGATVAFLISTPENGVDSIALSYALLGPFMTIARPIAGIISAVFAGLLAQLWGERTKPLPSVVSHDGCCGESEDKCCSSPKASEHASTTNAWQRLRDAMRYAFFDLFDDIALWLIVGLLLAAGVAAFVPPDTMASWGSGLLPMLGMVLIGIPMYICATASTPLGAALLLAGVSPGTVLVFLLAGPASNAATIAIVRRELGTRTMIAYLLGVGVGAIGMGLATDAVASAFAVNVTAQVIGHHEIIPLWLAWLCVAALAILMLRSLAKKAAKLRPRVSLISATDKLADSLPKVLQSKEPSP